MISEEIFMLLCGQYSDEYETPYRGMVENCLNTAEGRAYGDQIMSAIERLGRRLHIENACEDRDILAIMEGYEGEERLLCLRMFECGRSGAIFAAEKSKERAAK